MKYSQYVTVLLILLLHLCGFSQGNKNLANSKNFKDSIEAYSNLATVLNGSDTSRIFFYANKIFELSTKNNYLKGIGLAYYHIGFVYGNELKKDKALKNLNNALAIFKEINDPQITLTYIAIAGIYINLNEEITALEYLRKAEEISLKNKTEALTSKIYMNISQVYFNYNKIDDALMYLNKALFISKKLNRAGDLIICNTFIGDCYLTKKNYKAAIENYNYSINSCKDSNLEVLLLYSYNGLGNVYTELKQYDTALVNYYKAYDISKKFKNTVGILNFQYNISNFYLLKKEYKKVVEFAIQYLSQSEKIGNSKEISEIAIILSKAYEGLGNIKESLYYLKLFVENSTVYNEDKLNKFNAIVFDYEIKKKESEYLAVKQKDELELLKAKTKAQFWLIILIGSVTTLLLFILVFIIKMKNAKIERVKLTNQLQFKRKEMETLALHIIEKNNFLKLFRKNIDCITENSPISNDSLTKIKDLVYSNLKVTEERKDFNIYINNIHKDFFTNLSLKFPQLSESDKRLAALIKLNYSTKEIASILNITSKSAELKRYRLRKKANIPESVDLNHFFSNI